MYDSRFTHGLNFGDTEAMSRRAKIFVVIGCFAFVCLVVGAFYQKEIRIAYHRNRMWTAAENHNLLSLKPGRTVVPKLDGLRFLLFGMSADKEITAALQHEDALLKLGYLETREIMLTNRIFTGWSNIWPAFQHQVTNTFDVRNWFTYYFPETNKFAVTATPADMPKWERLISDFDKK